VAAIIAELPRTIRDRFVRAFAGGSGGLEDPLQALRDCLTRLEQDRLEGQIRVLREELRHAEARGDQPTVGRLVGEIDRLARRGRS